MTVINKDYDWAFPLTKRELTTHLILHHAAASKTTPDSIHAYHLSKGWAGIAYHYFIAKDGKIYRGRPENMRGGHTSNWNYCSIGICFEGNYEEEQMPEAQIKAGRELVNEIVSRYPSITIGRHSDYGQTECPGRYFPFDEIARRAETKDDAEHGEEPSKWAESACMWAAKEGLFRGDNSGNFRWRDFVTREELAVIMERSFLKIKP